MLVMSNMVAGRFAQEAQLYIDLESRLIEKSVVLEGRAAAGPVTATETQAGETPAGAATAEGADTQDTGNPAEAATTGPAEVSSST